MTNAQYVEKIFSSVDRIFVDTSTLMTRGFQQFICNNSNQLIAEEKKIIVQKAVYSELARHVESTDTEKNERAMAAFDLLASYKSIFCVEGASCTEEEIAHAFADIQLLAELTLNRSEYCQLLITNDRKLSCDAFDLNQQKSCKGRRVLVCYVDRRGELQCCDCVRLAANKAVAESTTMTAEGQPRGATKLSSESKTETFWRFDWLSGFMGVCSVGFIYGFFKSGKAFLRSIAKNG